MIRFKFRLAKLQKLAERNARQAASHCSDAQRVLREKESVRLELEGERERRGRACPAPGMRVRVDALASLQSHLTKLTADVRKAAAAERAQSLQVEQRRQLFVAAKREQRKFELLRERRFNEWKVESNRREQRMLDEVAGRQHGSSTGSRTADIAEPQGKAGRNT